jgi:hypothetical protein
MWHSDLVVFLDFQDVDRFMIRVHLAGDSYISAREGAGYGLVVEAINILLGGEDEISTVIFDAVERAFSGCAPMDLDFNISWCDRVSE